MGQTLSEPVTEKHTTTVLRDGKFWVGLSDMQGWRISMEDSHSVHLFLPPSNKAPKPVPDKKIPAQPEGSTVTNHNTGTEGNAFIGVFDGHGGANVAKYTGTTIHTRLADSQAYHEGEYEKALKEVFLRTDEDLRAEPKFVTEPSGCTAVVGLITEDGRIIVANAGDSRSVLGYKGEAKPLSFDHKPTNKDETQRITSAGGFVEFGRVNGNLALSRAIGDFEFKQNFSLRAESQIVTADPEIHTHKIDGEEEFLVLACDGIWDCLSSQQVIDFTRRAVANGDSLGKICEDMMLKCLAGETETGGIGCDNMTVVIVALLNGRTPEEWQAWVKERVDKKIGYDTPERVADVFAPASSTPGLGALTGAGFRVAGQGGLANIASLLGASGMRLQQVDDSDDDESSNEDSTDKSNTDTSKYIDNKALEKDTKPVDVTDSLDHKSSKKGSARVDEDGDSTMSDDGSDDTIPAAETTTGEPLSSSSPPRTSSFTSMGHPKVPTPEALQTTPGGDAVPQVAKVEGLMDTSEDPLKM